MSDNAEKLLNDTNTATLFVRENWCDLPEPERWTVDIADYASDFDYEVATDSKTGRTLLIKFRCVDDGFKHPDLQTVVFVRRANGVEAEYSKIAFDHEDPLELRAQIQQARAKKKIPASSEQIDKAAAITAQIINCWVNWADRNDAEAADIANAEQVLALEISEGYIKYVERTDTVVYTQKGKDAYEHLLKRRGIPWANSRSLADHEYVMQKIEADRLAEAIGILDLVDSPKMQATFKAERLGIKVVHKE